MRTQAVIISSRFTETLLLSEHSLEYNRLRRRRRLTPNPPAVQLSHPDLFCLFAEGTVYRLASGKSARERSPLFLLAQQACFCSMDMECSVLHRREFMLTVGACSLTGNRNFTSSAFKESLHVHRVFFMFFSFFPHSAWQKD